jgi:hypothetical protein
MCMSGVDNDEAECGECAANESSGFHGWMSE